ncbi:type IV pilin protein [Motilimonas pumila]|uniref:Prepilin-type N-terminal cleavage/methylation domain-containing protein n=1 Tax=Motilimonas pumila TaxID=2303987 RepID=A0A418YJX7_9GAMM|nr:type IV pilin protein [Motilimonas pumila]RJG51274.1 prepilin-type N-terminal cleavage/methylation domain-containing protein [Motilimonas pumila]
MKATRSHGFSLIEILVVIAIIGILASIAYPSYQSHVQKTRRTDAQSILMQGALEQESHRITNTTYSAAIADIGIANNDDYEFSITGNTATAYTIKATAKTGSTQQTDKAGATNCKEMTINQSDVKTPSACW